MADLRTQAQRPLSPHLSIYRPILTMVMSILHRITGGALYVGTLLLVWWLVAAAAGPDAFATAQGFFGSWFGQIVLFGYTWALIHHMSGGVRHFIWDFGLGHDVKTRNFLAQATIVGSVAVTMLIWIVALIVR